MDQRELFLAAVAAVNPADMNAVEEVVHPEMVFHPIPALDDGRLFAAGKVRIRGRGSHVDTVVDTAGYASFRDGLLCEWHDYGDRAAALAALGLT